ncbi:hypothetical protein [Longispora albida]|uniref:hypothetical protein n=1 Tax=Longispora albida TaxID=203523 RepID=UPI000375FCA6|nr:hypothetical protein [Longispora albida]
MSDATSSPPVRLGAFIGGLAVALTAGYLIGKVAPNDPAQPAAHNHGGTKTTAASPGGGHDHTAPAVTGFAISQDGYTLVPARTTFTAGETAPLSFTIAGPTGKPVTDFAVKHEKKLHLLVVRRDLTGYQHIHPVLGEAGRWEVPLTLREPGSYRMFADFTTGSTELTLGADLTVPGVVTPQPLPAPAREAKPGGHDVTYEGTPRAGSTQPLLFRVFASGSPITNIEKYLGAYGHLIVLREGDAGYVHAHAETDLAGGAIKFWFAAPSPGRYRAFLDYQVGGTVRTAEFTMQVGPGPATG